MTILALQIHFETSFSVNQRDFWEREKRGLISYLSAWGSDQRVLLQNTAQPEKKVYL